MLFAPNNINNDLNLFNVERFEPFFNFYNKNFSENFNHISNLFFKDFNLNFLYKLKNSNHFFNSINKFFDFNLINFYNLKNKMESYKNLMAIKSVYEYRFANNAFNDIEELIFIMFKTPLDNYIYFNELYKNLNYIIFFNIFSKFEKNFFFEDLFNFNKKNFFQFFLHFLRFFSKLFKIRIYFFQFGLLWNLIKTEKNENLLRIRVFRLFYNFFSKKLIFYLVKKIKKNNFKKKWSIKNFFNIIKYNSMFYLDIYSMSILFYGWIYEIALFFRLMIFTNIYNKFLRIFDLYDYYKYLISFKDFFFQLINENIEYSLIFIFLNIKKIKLRKNYLYINNRNKISNNFIYRKYMLYTWLEHNYYRDLFNDLKTFKKDIYSIKLNKWILRYFYEKSELYMFYSESLHNKFINKKCIFF